MFFYRDLHKRPQQAIMGGSLLLVANDLIKPDVVDLYNHFIVIEMPYSFTTDVNLLDINSSIYKKADLGLEDYLSQDYTCRAFLNLVIKYHTVTPPEYQHDMHVLQYINDLSNTGNMIFYINKFFDITKNVKDIVTFEDLKKLFSMHCQGLEFNFYDFLKQLHRLGIKRIRKKVNDKVIRFYAGLKVKTIEENK
jgi:hypothetical protein